jgi:hypothetical protein
MFCIIYESIFSLYGSPIAFVCYGIKSMLYEDEKKNLYDPVLTRISERKEIYVYAFDDSNQYSAVNR